MDIAYGLGPKPCHTFGSTTFYYVDFKPFTAPKKLNLDIFEKNMQDFPPGATENLQLWLPNSQKIKNGQGAMQEASPRNPFVPSSSTISSWRFISWPALDTLHVILLVGTILKKLANSLKDVSGRLSDRSCWWTLSTWDWNKSTSSSIITSFISVQNTLE